MLTPAKPKRCVIADDVRASRELLQGWLVDSGFECSLAVDGTNAWELIQEQPPDLVLTDIQMPNCSGLELIQKMRRSSCSTLRSIPVLVMTSLHDDEIQRVVQELGGNGLLAKPLDRHSTYSVVLNLLSEGLSGDQLIVNDPQHRTSGNGCISPTLRRLIRAVAIKET